jgi:hypothetical protein
MRDAGEGLLGVDERGPMNVRLGSRTVLTALKRHFRVTPRNGHHQVGPVRAKPDSCNAADRADSLTMATTMLLSKREQQ